MPYLENLPPEWSPVPRSKKRGGGQATITHVRHEDGREGVYRELKIPVSEVESARFRREVKILSQLDHRGIVPLLSWSLDGEELWYISELGDPFGRWWKQVRRALQDDPVSLVDKAVWALQELLSAVSTCHANGIIHRDIKPSNMVVKRQVAEPWPMLIDFGLVHRLEETRLTPTDEAVGNARFSPDIMRNRLDDVPPWLDVFDLAQLFIWMVEVQAPKHNWQRPVHWRYAAYNSLLLQETELSIRAFTAACSHQEGAPANGKECLDLLNNLFSDDTTMQVAPEASSEAIRRAKHKGVSNRLIAEAALEEEIEAGVPLAKKVYLGLREGLLSALQGIRDTEPSAHVMFDEPFQYSIIGATDLLGVYVGPPDVGIQLRIKAKVVPRSPTSRFNEKNQRFWLKHLPNDVTCFTFAIEGGVVQAHDITYLQGRWVTVRRDGEILLHPLDAGFGTYKDNDLGGSPKGPGTLASMEDVHAFALAVLTNEEYWEYISASCSADLL